MKIGQWPYVAAHAFPIAALLFFFFFLSFKTLYFSQMEVGHHDRWQNTEHCLQQDSKKSGTGKSGQHSREGGAVPAHFGCVHVVIVDVDPVWADVQVSQQFAVDAVLATANLTLWILSRLQRAQGPPKAMSWSRTMCTDMYCGGLSVACASCCVSCNRNPCGTEEWGTLVRSILIMFSVTDLVMGNLHFG